MDEVQDTGIMFRVDNFSLKDYEHSGYIDYHIEQNEKEAIYKAVKQVKNKWICIKVDTEKRNDCASNHTEWITKVRCRAVQTQNVYIPVYSEVKSENRMPKDVYLCKYCGGYTKNDSRGNCAACGAGRTYEK